MNRVKKSTFSLLYILKKSKLLKNGEAPICLRITVQGQVAEVMVKRSISVPLWNQAKECSNGKQYKDKELNHYLETIKAKFYQIHRELEIDGKKVTANAVRDRYYGKDEGSKTFVDVQQLTPNHLIKDNNGAMWIRKSRQKTGNMCNIPVFSVFDTNLHHFFYVYRRDSVYRNYSFPSLFCHRVQLLCQFP